MRKWINILLLLAVAVFSLWCAGDLMRKNDQAIILAGAQDLVQGRMQDPSAYYQYDKTYILYWACAAVFKLLPAGTSPVAAANISLSVMFWSALTVFVVRFRRATAPLALLCFLTSPAILLNTLYVNSSVLSSAFLLLSAVFLFQDGSRGGWPAAVFFALAVGSRADVILLLPLMIWLITPFPVFENFFADLSGKRNRRYRALVAVSKHVKILSAGVLALSAGRLLYPGAGAVSDPFFNIKMVVGYTVFGFGAAGLLFAVYSFYLGMQMLKGRGAPEKLHALAGLVAFLVPVLFFIPQLHTPRYFWRGCEAVILLAASGLIPAWNYRPGKVLLLSAALLPLVWGMRLPALNRPQITVSHPALFPSGDGYYPMGGYLPFMTHLRNATLVPVDHNQLIWNAVKQVEFRFDNRKQIRVLRTPMSGYFMLAASLQGGRAECWSFTELSNSFFYADSRSLMRIDPKTPIFALTEILSLPSHFISPVFEGIGILEFGVGDNQWGLQTRLLNRLFCGNEYRVIPAGLAALPDRMSLVFSAHSFETGLQDSQTGLYYSKSPPARLPPDVFCAVAVFPPWMSFQSFNRAVQ